MKKHVIEQPHGGHESALSYSTEIEPSTPAIQDDLDTKIVEFLGVSRDIIPNTESAEEGLREFVISRAQAVVEEHSVKIESHGQKIMVSRGHAPTKEVHGEYETILGDNILYGVRLAKLLVDENDAMHDRILLLLHGNTTFPLAVISPKIHMIHEGDDIHEMSTKDLLSLAYTIKEIEADGIARAEVQQERRHQKRHKLGLAVGKILLSACLLGGGTFAGERIVSALQHQQKIEAAAHAAAIASEKASIIHFDQVNNTLIVRQPAAVDLPVFVETTQQFANQGVPSFYNDEHALQSLSQDASHIREVTAPRIENTCAVVRTAIDPGDIVRVAQDGPNQNLIVSYADTALDKLTMCNKGSVGTASNNNSVSSVTTHVFFQIEKPVK